jgi:endonuclease-3
MPSKIRKPKKAAGSEASRAVVKPAKSRVSARGKKTQVRRAPPKPARESPEAKSARAVRISAALGRLYNHKGGTALEYRDPFQLLISVILSAQCTDEQVNRTTPALFARYPDAAAMAAADPADIERLVHSTGFYRQKTKSLMAASRDIVERFGGRAPREMDELTSLRGVGRKTANCVRAYAFGEPGLTVDTHFKRLAGRMGLTENTDPDKIEADLAALLPPERWIEMSDGLIWHGRAVCKARGPECGRCAVLADCPFGREAIEKSG